MLSIQKEDRLDIIYYYYNFEYLDKSACQEAYIVLLFDDVNNLDALVADYINEGLKRGQFCVYASVYLRDGRHHMEKLSILIDDYKENVRKENLLVVDLAPLCSDWRRGAI